MVTTTIAIYKFHLASDASLTSARINRSIGSNSPLSQATIYNGGCLVEIRECCKNIEEACKLCASTGGELVTIVN